MVSLQDACPKLRKRPCTQQRGGKPDGQKANDPTGPIGQMPHCRKRVKREINNNTNTARCRRPTTIQLRIGVPGVLTYCCTMKNLASLLSASVIISAIALSGCGSSEAKDDSSPKGEAVSSAASHSAKPPQRSSTPEELKNQIHGVDGVRVSEIGDHLEVSVKASTGGAKDDQQATLNVLLAVAEYTEDYEYVLIAGSDKDGTWSYSYDKDTVEEIAKRDSAPVSKIWDLADKEIEPR